MIEPGPWMRGQPVKGIVALTFDVGLVPRVAALAGSLGRPSDTYGT